MESILIPLIVFSAIVAVVKIVADARIKNRLIDKGLVDEKIKYLYQGSPESRALSNLKWGIVLIGIGVAALLSHWFPHEISHEGTIGLMFVFAGVGFLTYSFLAPKRLRDDKDSLKE